MFGDSTPGLVCAHHHLYSAMARGMPPPPSTPTTFLAVLEQIWWRLDTALDLEMLEWSAKLGALEALEAGCTAIIDHHESPNAIEGSLSVIADACAEIGVRVVASYGVTDRHGAAGALRGLEENDRFLREGGRGMVGVHAAFTCSDDTLAAAAELATRHGVGVHIHVAEGPDGAFYVSDDYAGLRAAPCSAVRHGSGVIPAHADADSSRGFPTPRKYEATERTRGRFAMAAAIALRDDLDGPALQRLAKSTKVAA